MPAIFNDENKNEIKKQMLDNGFELIRKYGIKRMTVTEIAKTSGLAKGTFYTFFSSKEEFIFEILVSRRHMIKQKYMELAEQHGGIGRKELVDFFQYINTADVDAYKYMTEQDMNYMATKWPKEHNFNPKADEETTLWLISHMRGLQKNINWKVLANYMKTIALMEMKKDALHADALQETIDVFTSGLLNYLFLK